MNGMASGIEVGAILSWPGMGLVTVCAFFWFLPGQPVFVTCTGLSTWQAFEGLWAQAAEMNKVTAYTRN